MDKSVIGNKKIGQITQKAKKIQTRELGSKEKRKKKEKREDEFNSNTTLCRPTKKEKRERCEGIER